MQAEACLDSHMRLLDPLLRKLQLRTLVSSSFSYRNCQRQLLVWYVTLAPLNTMRLISTFTPCSAGGQTGGPGSRR